MNKPAGNAVRLHRVLRAPPERVYRAFVDPDALVKWMAPHGFTAKVHSLDVRVGGKYRMSFTNLTTGKSHAFGGEFLDIVPNESLRYTDQFEDPNLPGVIEVFVQLKPVLIGTELTIAQVNLPAAIPVEFCYAGWGESLHLLALLVEAHIPDDV